MNTWKLDYVSCREEGENSIVWHIIVITTFVHISIYQNTLYVLSSLIIWEEKKESKQEQKEGGRIYNER